GGNPHAARGLAAEGEGDGAVDARSQGRMGRGQSGEGGERPQNGIETEHGPTFRKRKEFGSVIGGKGRKLRREDASAALQAVVQQRRAGPEEERGRPP